MVYCLSDILGPYLSRYMQIEIQAVHELSVVFYNLHTGGRNIDIPRSGKKGNTCMNKSNHSTSIKGNSQKLGF